MGILRQFHRILSVGASFVERLLCSFLQELLTNYASDFDFSARGRRFSNEHHRDNHGVVDAEL